jgi:hypothetical protein
MTQDDKAKRQRAEVVYVFKRIEDTIEMAELALEDWCGEDQDKRIPGLKTFLVQSRAITNVLENLRSKVEDFDAWYKPTAIRMRADEHMHYLYKLRSEILKTGVTPVAFSIEPRPPLARVQMDTRFLEPPPFPGALWVLSEVGPRWEGMSETGDFMRAWSTVPEQWGLSWQTFGDLPNLQVPDSLKRASITETCEAHLFALCTIVDEAYEQFYPADE